MNEENCIRTQTSGTRRVYVHTAVEFTADGRVLPQWFRWPDGRLFIIDRVRRIHTNEHRKGESSATRYSVVIRGKECALYYERGRGWFLERKPCASEPDDVS